ncbi:hypothetical protein SDC9_92101 [bioreactor metagenome]|uniref:Uncharacterized protein n=1 Tax=bioreactor metagenome TaxID=1076179 RepID=A0A645A6M9_9ZZZZ
MVQLRAHGDDLPVPDEEVGALVEGVAVVAGNDVACVSDQQSSHGTRPFRH